MALTLINDTKVPRYTALSTDISLSKIAGLTYIGALVYILDTGATYIVSDAAGTLATYTQPSGAITGSVSIVGTPNVAVTGIAAGENHIGEMGGRCSIITATPVLSVAGAYSIGDFVGTSSASITLASAARVSGGSGTIHTVTLIDYAKQAKSLELWLFDSAVTPPTDNAVWSISDADSLKSIGIVAFNTWYDSDLNSISVATNVGIAFKTVSGTSIYGCLVTRGTPAYTTGDLSIRLAILQN